MNTTIDKELSKKLKGKRFKIGYCYDNSFKIFQENRNSDIEYFVIGYCKRKNSFMAFRHAWNLSKEGKIVDVSLHRKDLDKYEYYEAFKYSYDEFYREDVILNSTSVALKGLNVEAELKCITDNSLYVIEEDLINWLFPYI